MVWANAGIAQAFTPIEQIGLDDFDRLMAINAKGPWLTARQALPTLREGGGGSIVITASLSGLKARPNLSAYQTSKGAAVMLTQSLAAEFAPLGIRVNSVCPVAAETPMLPEFSGVGGDPDAFHQAVTAAVPLGRLAQPKDVASAALYLASEEAAMVTGVNFPVDGGSMA